MIRQPQKWWFAVPLPAAFLLSYMIWMARTYSDLKGFGDFLKWTGDLASIGLRTFPLGLPGALWIDKSILSGHSSIFICCGYLLYVALMLVGALKSLWRILLLFAIILAMNIVGCQMDNTIQSIVPG